MCVCSQELELLFVETQSIMLSEFSQRERLTQNDFSHMWDKETMLEYKESENKEHDY